MVLMSLRGVWGAQLRMHVPSRYGKGVKSLQLSLSHS